MGQSQRQPAAGLIAASISPPSLPETSKLTGLPTCPGASLFTHAATGPDKPANIGLTWVTICAASRLASGFILKQMPPVLMTVHIAAFTAEDRPAFNRAGAEFAGLE